MSIAVDEIKHVARLAGLRLSESELQKYQKELTSILDHIHQLDKMAADDVLSPERVAVTLSNVRSDTICRSLAAVDALKNAPSVRVGMFNVPKVI